MSACPNCGHEVMDSDQVCQNCGLDMKTGRKFILNTNPLGFKAPPGSSIKKEGDDLVIRITNGKGINKEYMVVAMIAVMTLGLIVNYVALSAALALLTFLTMLAVDAIMQMRKTEIRATETAVTVVTPNGEQSMINSAEIRQVYCKVRKEIVKESDTYRYYGRSSTSRYLRRSMAIPVSGYSGRETVTRYQYVFSVIAVLSKGGNKTIIDNLKSGLLAQFIEEKLEERYGIMDVAISDEFEAARKANAMRSYLPSTTSEGNITAEMDLTELVTRRTQSGFETLQKWSKIHKIDYANPVTAVLMVILILGLIEENNAIKFSIIAVVAAFAAYLLAAYFKNSTRVEVSEKGIKASCFPVPFPMVFSIDRNAITEVYVDEKLIDGSMPQYNVKALTANGRSSTILYGLKRLETAQDMAYFTKHTLKIK